MLEFLWENLATVIVAAVIAVVVVLIIANMARARKKGGGSCGSGCSGCPNAGICHAHAPKDR